MIRTLRGIASLLCLLSCVGVSSVGAATKAKTVVNYTLIRAGNTDVVYVLSWAGCEKASCFGLYRTNVSGSPFAAVTLPPMTSTQRVDRVVFANAQDGYATIGNYFPSTLYMTTNGARSWRKVMSGHDMTYEVTTTANGLLVSSVQCVPRTDNCGQYTVRRGSLAATHWVALPDLWKTGNKPDERLYGPSLATYGNTVWELETDSNSGSGVYMWTSHNRGRTFVRTEERFPQLVSVNGCSLYPMSPFVLWAQCPTGMQVSFSHSINAGGTWRSVSQSQFFGTGGGAFDPVTGNVAYLGYGGVQAKKNFVRLSDGGHVATAIGELKCTNVSFVFVTVARGLMVCDENYSRSVLRTTNDGGARWIQDSSVPAVI
jgi:hypothetical protein